MAVGLLSAASREAATLSMARTLAANAAFVLSLSKDGGSPYVAVVRQVYCTGTWWTGVRRHGGRVGGKFFCVHLEPQIGR
jgi:hypothetical protein